MYYTVAPGLLLIASSFAVHISAFVPYPYYHHLHPIARKLTTTTSSSSSSSRTGDINNMADTTITSFDILRERISSNASDSSVQLILSSSISMESKSSTAIEINSLIFRPKPSQYYVSNANNDAEEAAENNAYAVAIVKSTDKVDISKLSKELAKECSIYGKWELAPSYLVEDLCGFRPGSIPPLGYANTKTPLKIIADTSLTMLPDDQQLIGGGGNIDYRCLLSASSIVELVDTTADIIITITSSSRVGERFDGGMTMTVEPSQSQSQKENYYYNRQNNKPFFCVAPPRSGSVNGDGIVVVDDQQSPPQPHRPIPVTAIGRITSVRQIAKRLVFFDFAPPDYPMNALSASENGPREYDMPWRSGEDGDPMYVQMIVGKTFIDSLGETEGPEALKKLKPGRLVIIRGAANVDPRQKNGWSNSAGNWAQKRSLDVIVSSFDILSNSDEVETVIDEHISSLDILPWEVKKRQQGSMNNNATGNNDNGVSRKGSEAPQPPHPPDPSENPVLTLALFDSTVEGSATDVILVDTADRAETMANHLEDLSAMATSAEGDDDALDFLVGIDCEWRPTVVCNSNPVALLQIGVPALKKIFLVDLYTLLRPGLGLSSPEIMTPTEAVLDKAIATIFQSTAILKTGFNVATDFRRLAASFPHMSAFLQVHGVLELSTFAKKIHPTSSRHSLGSLQRLTRFVLGYDVSKTQQCSDWEQRPLTSEQTEYAALDCALPPRLIKDMAEGAGRAKTQTVLPQCTSSWRFTTMDSSCQEAITLLKAKRVVRSTFVVSQSWLTGKSSPAAPAMPAKGGGPYIDKSGISRMPSHLVNIHDPSTDANVTWGSMIGKSVGRSKGKCVELVAAHALPPGTKLEFNPRGGFVPFLDGIVLFINMPAPKSRRSPYPNEWLNDGRVLTWYLREKDWGEGKSETARLLGFGSGGDSSGNSNESSVLFVRSISGDFICCGRCTVSAPPAASGKQKGDNLIKLHLELSQWNSLKDMPMFADIVNSMAVTDKSTNDEVAEEETGLVDVATLAKDSTSFQQCLARMVIDGNVVDALGFALEASNTDPKKRSLVAGIGCLKKVFARSNDADVLKAVEILDDAAANLGLF